MNIGILRFTEEINANAFVIPKKMIKVNIYLNKILITI